MVNILELRKVVGNVPLTVCAAGVLILDDQNRVLLIKRGDDGNWCIPGGVMDTGESVYESTKREVFEETNMTLNQMDLFNVYSGQEQHHIYPNGDEVYFVNIVFITKSFSGMVQTDGIESKDFRFFELKQIPLDLSPTNKPFLEDLGLYLEGN
ncbi:NUDIX domain-containing protein [Bacillus carboniphilus]|uniref:NUDIX domain-containing protein n=1 Tax=Bacillus carboniphilus TaxID=86663 RepID=A0ABY9JUP4_9BACI|nr:NUDIX domain-containing protein [Bacillus carboniphilus]WLR42208.1 NUDIX domain-containing protein [Bacillus carboniphilus]